MAIPFRRLGCFYWWHSSGWNACVRNGGNVSLFFGFATVFHIIRHSCIIFQIGFIYWSASATETPMSLERRRRRFRTIRNSLLLHGSAFQELPFNGLVKDLSGGDGMDIVAVLNAFAWSDPLKCWREPVAQSGNNPHPPKGSLFGSKNFRIFLSSVLTGIF